MLIVACVATASLTVAACGGAGTDDPTAGGVGNEEKKAMLQFAQCMRDHGVDMPDPTFSGGRVEMRVGGPGRKRPDRETAQAAQAACKQYQDAIKPPALSASEKAELKQRALANARCMRAHGIDFPDPQFDADGGARVRLTRSVNPDDPAFQRAQAACEKEAPIGDAPGTTTRSAG
jgi:hypothetical protein